jgi:glycine oxidase
MAKRLRVTVAGAGALGLSCALALADAGFEVTVCDPADPADPAANASAVAGGMLAPVAEAVLDPEAKPHFGLLLWARNLWPALEARARVRLDRSGALVAGRAGWLEAVAGEMTRLGARPIPVPRGAAEGLAPGLARDVEGVLLGREDWRLDPQAALAALRAAAAEAGASFRRDVVRERGDADLLVLAVGAGPALATLAPELGRLTPIKGHILRVSGLARPAMTVRGEGIYVTPTDGALAVGATMEAGVADPQPDPAKAEPLAAAGAALFPAMSGAPQRLLAGVRAASPDGLPLVGFSRAPGVLLAAGARRNGWLLAPLVAQVVTALATGRDPGPYASRLDPARFEP